MRAVSIGKHTRTSFPHTYALTEIQLAHTGILHLFHITKSLVDFNTEARGHIDRRRTRSPDLVQALPAGPAVRAPFAPVRSDCQTACSAGESDAAACPQLASAPPSACLSVIRPPPGMPAAPAAERYTAWLPVPRSSAQPSTNTHIHTEPHRDTITRRHADAHAKKRRHAQLRTNRYTKTHTNKHTLM